MVAAPHAPSSGFVVRVDYRLGEYLQVLQDFVPVALARKAAQAGNGKHGVRPLKWHQLIMMRFVGTLAFIYKSARVGACTFEVTSSEISRSSKSGVLRLPWSDVTQVYRLSGSYLIEKSAGAMPIPFRVLNESNQRLLESLAGSKLVAV